MFKNTRFFRYTSNIPESEEELNAALAEFAFQACGPFSEKSSGWEPPADGTSMLVRQVEKASQFRLRVQSRVLPTAAINDALEIRVAEFRQRMGHEPGRSERRRLKAETRENLISKALLKSDRTAAFFLHTDQLLGIDAASPSRADQILDLLRMSFPKSEFTPLVYKRSFGRMFTDMLGGNAPAGLVTGRECVLQDMSDVRARVRWTDIDLSATMLQKLMREGMAVTQLGMTFADVLSFTLSDAGVLSKVRLIGMDSTDEIELEDPLARHDADFVLMSGTYRRLLRCFEAALATGGQADSISESDT